MPDFLTHALFAQDLLDRGGFSLCGRCRRHANLFRFGSQGPDLLYYLDRLSPGQGYGRIADRLHLLEPAEILQFMHGLDPGDPDHSFSCAYLSGYAAHLCLDGHVHPMIEARAAALGKQLGCSEDCAHVKYENRLESRHYAEKTGQAPCRYLFRGDLPATDREKKLVSSLNQALVRQYLGKPLRSGPFMRALNRLPALLCLLFDPDKKVQKLVDRLFARRELTLKWRFKRDYQPDPLLLPQEDYEAFLKLYDQAIQDYQDLLN